ncbi:MAG TPA: roadblock/LC7 domain-containing protein [Pseudomonadota bacterium]|nr:roadblock/LC7 domain-containing protein [Pseudomonadota bacterium]
MEIRSSQVFAAMCKEQLRLLLASADGADSAAIVSGDGFDIASQLHDNISPGRIAAMTSSLHALALAASGELALGANRSVVVESELGTLVVLRVPSTQAELLLSVIARSSSVLGSVLFAARRCVDAIGLRMSGYA